MLLVCEKKCRHSGTHDRSCQCTHFTSIPLFWLLHLGFCRIIGFLYFTILLVSIHAATNIWTLSQKTECLTHGASEAQHPLKNKICFPESVSLVYAVEQMEQLQKRLLWKKKTLLMKTAKCYFTHWNRHWTTKLNCNANCSGEKSGSAWMSLQCVSIYKDKLWPMPYTLCTYFLLIKHIFSKGLKGLFWSMLKCDVQWCWFSKRTKCNTQYKAIHLQWNYCCLD